MKLVDQDIDWHDGNLVDVQVSGLSAKKQDIRLYLDLYPSDETSTSRRRYCCTGDGLRRFLISGDVPRLVKNSKAGNIEYMRMDISGETEILTVFLFGAVIEAEATNFQLVEVKK
jgi:hypothetical protein